MSTDVVPNSIANLAAFVASTIGRIGEVHRGRDAFCVASPVPVANGFVNAAFVLDPEADRGAAIDEATQFFRNRESPFIVWVPEGDEQLRNAIGSAGGVVDHAPSPDMIIDHRIDTPPLFDVRVVESDGDFAVCARLCEEGYGIDGMAWLMDHHRMASAPTVTWAIAYDGDEPLGVGCGFTDGLQGGVYYVATPSRNARRGVAGAVTTWMVNRLFDGGVRSVVLQASAAGFPVYERLGFRVEGHLERFRFLST